MKSPFSFRIMLGLLVCAFSPVWAQPASQVPAVEAPTDTPLDIDPQAKKVMEELLARYKNLRSYSDVTTLQTKNGTVDWSAETTWERPNKALIVRKKENRVWRAVSDGTTMWALNPDHPDSYLQCPADAGRIFTPFHETDTAGPGTGVVLGDYSFDELLKDGLRVLRFQGEEKIDGVSTQLVTAKLEFDDGGSGVLTFYVGVEDGMLHQIVADYSGIGQGVKLIEKHTAIRFNPELAPDTWRFVPPAGLKPTDTFQKFDPRRFEPRYKPGDLLPPFEAIDINGKKVALADYGDENKVVLLFFFLARSGEVQTAYHKQLLKRYQDQGLAVIGISLDARREAVEKFVKDNEVPFPIVFDGQGWQNAVAVKYGVRTDSVVFLVGRDGRLLPFSGVARGAFTPVGVDDAIEAALKVPK